MNFNFLVISSFLLLLVGLIAYAGEPYSSLQIAALVDVGTTRASGTVTYEAEIRRFHEFTPAYITVKPGTTIIWTNNDVVEHNVHILKGKNNKLGSDIISDLVFPGKNTAITFTHEGDYRYLCNCHPYMQGYVYVKNTDEITGPLE